MIYHPEINKRDLYSIIYKRIIYFSLFKSVPEFLRPFVYDNEFYLSVYGLPAYQVNNIYSSATISNYAALYYLPAITRVTDDAQKNAVIMVNDLTHEPAFFQPPDYVPAPLINDKGTGPFKDEDTYHVNMAALKLLGTWFDFLKESGVYDNTRIVIVSDHGAAIHSPFPGNIQLPNEEEVQAYNALLLVKDFNADGALKTDWQFMTNADTPLLAAAGLVPEPRNPFTGSLLRAQKDEGAVIITAHHWQLDAQLRYRYRVKPDEWLHTRDNIFDSRNWRRICIED